METRRVMEVREELLIAKTFLRDNFFKDIKHYTSDELEIHTKSKKLKILPVVTEYSKGTALEKTGFKREKLMAPRLNPYHTIGIKDIFKDLEAGENPYEKISFESKLQRKKAEFLAEQELHIAHMEELQASQILFGGVLKLYGLDELGNKKEYDVNYQIKNKIVLDTANSWKQSSVNPLKDLDKWLRLYNESGRKLGGVVMGIGASELLQWHDITLKALNTRKLDIGEISPKELPSGVTYIGTYKGMDLYEYQFMYEDENGVKKNMIPEFGVSFTSSNHQVKYGALYDFRNKVVTKARESYEVVKPKVIKVETESKPLLVPEDIASIVTIDVEGV